MVTLTNLVFARTKFILRGALGTLEIFGTFFCQIIGEDQKKLPHLSARPSAGFMPYYGKFGPDYCIAFIKRLDEGLK